MKKSRGAQRYQKYTPVMHAYLLSVGPRHTDEIDRQVARSEGVNWLDLSARLELTTALSFCASKIFRWLCPPSCPAQTVAALSRPKRRLQF
jgi:hypothetical protein